MTGKWFDTLVLMVLENTAFLDTKCQFVDYFAQQGTTFVNWHGAGHPSGPNYRALVSGNTWSTNEFDGVTRPNIGRYVDYSVVAFRGEPAIRHNPFLDMNNDPKIVSDQLWSGFTDIVYLGLDDTNNAHSAPLTVADANVTSAVKKTKDLAVLNKKRILFFLVFDEAFGSEYPTNHVYAGACGINMETPVKQVTSLLTHFNFAQMLADNWAVNFPEMDARGRTFHGLPLWELP